MDLKYTLLVFCLIFVQGSTEGCVDLVQDFFLFRDGLMEYFGMCSDAESSLEHLEDALGFALTSDEHWRGMLCAIEDVEDLAGLTAVLNDYIDGPLSEHTVAIVLMQIQGMQEEFATIIPPVVNYQRKVQPWLAKTNFPHTWPVPNTGKKETARMMARGEGGDFNVLTYESDDTNYKKFAKAMLRADTLDEYLSVVNEDMLGDTGTLECYSAMLDILRDSDRFTVVPETAAALVRVLAYLRESGLFDLVPESPSYYNYYH